MPFLTCNVIVLSRHFLNSLGKVQQDPAESTGPACACVNISAYQENSALLVSTNVNSNQLVTDCSFCVFGASPIFPFSQPPQVPCLLSHFPLSLHEFSDILLFPPPSCLLFFPWFALFALPHWQLLRQNRNKWFPPFPLLLLTSPYFLFVLDAIALITGCHKCLFFQKVLAAPRGPQRLQGVVGRQESDCCIRRQMEKHSFREKGW